MLPDATVAPALSTAEAAATLADGSGPHDAAIAAPIAAERYRLEVLASDVEDNPDAVTRFVLVGRPDQPPLPTGHDKTTLVAFISDDHAGALLEVLTEFAVRGVNLTRIESRPTGEGMGRYCFSIDCEGHVDDARVGEALTGLRRVCPDIRFLGSYPRADRGPAADQAERDCSGQGRGLPRRRGLARPHPQRQALTLRSDVRPDGLGVAALGVGARRPAPPRAGRRTRCRGRARSR